jgi:hypothetical protein
VQINHRYRTLIVTGILPAVLDRSSHDLADDVAASARGNCRCTRAGEMSGTDTPMSMPSGACVVATEKPLHRVRCVGFRRREQVPIDVAGDSDR